MIFPQLCTSILWNSIVFIPDYPFGLKNWPYSPVLYRLLEVNIEKNDRMSIKEAQSIPIFPFLWY